MRSNDKESKNLSPYRIYVDRYFVSNPETTIRFESLIPEFLFLPRLIKSWEFQDCGHTQNWCDEGDRTASSLLTLDVKPSSKQPASDGNSSDKQRTVKSLFGKQFFYEYSRKREIHSINQDNH